MKFIEFLVGENGLLWSVLYIIFYLFLGFSIFVLVALGMLLFAFLHPIFALFLLCIGFLISTYVCVRYFIYLYRLHKLNSVHMDIVINSFFFSLSFLGAIWLCVMLF